MIVGASCLSHTPYMDRARTDQAVEQRFFAAVSTLAAEVAQLDVDLVVVFHPDHYNGFFYNLMPAFCIGIEARSIGDYSTVEGELPVASEAAADLVATCLADGVDVAFAQRMEVDHGVAQPLEMLFADARLPPVIPVFVNCAAPPRPSFARARALGESVGRWAERRPERIWVIASGGMSHDPPIPNFSKASGEQREKLIAGGRSSFAARLARQANVYAVGQAFVAGRSKVLPINEDWDRATLETLSSGDFSFLDGVNDDDLTATAGGGAHELRTWIAALSALAQRGRVETEVRFYAPITEWITGTAVVKAVAV